MTASIHRNRHYMRIHPEPRAHDRRPSQASTTSCASTTSTTSSLMTPPITVPSQSNQLPVNPLDSPPVPFSPSPSPPPPPPLLTSSFRARDLLREVKELRELPGQGIRDVSVEDGVVEFVEPRVPDGISLRNFGIQSVSICVPVIFFPRTPFPPTLRSALVSASSLDPLFLLLYCTWGSISGVPPYLVYQFSLVFGFCPLLGLELSRMSQNEYTFYDGSHSRVPSITLFVRMKRVLATRGGPFPRCSPGWTSLAPGHHTIATFRTG